MREENHKKITDTANKKFNPWGAILPIAAALGIGVTLWSSFTEYSDILTYASGAVVGAVPFLAAFKLDT